MYQLLTPLTKKRFPTLSADNCRKTSDPVDLYNCIAWAAGDNTQWWQPRFNGVSDPNQFWPDGASDGVQVEDIASIFREMGFVDCDTGGAPEDGWTKIVFYSDNDGVFLHVAKQDPDGGWSSKLAELEDIWHGAPEDLVGPYGKISCFLKKEEAG